VSFVSYRPGPPLNEFVDYLWLIEGGQAARLEKILPSGTIELVVNLKNDEIHIHDPEQPEQFKMFSGAVVSGTYERSFICNAQQHEAILGVHFKRVAHFRSWVPRQANLPMHTPICLICGEGLDSSCANVYAQPQPFRSAFGSSTPR
jgi:hypothetical protein